jgi:stage II sporulation SpoE-like protein
VPARERRQVSTLDFPPGAVLCLYTDGLVERRDQPIDEGIARLRAAVTTADPEAGCASVMAAMAGYTPHTDDIALLMLRRTPDTAAARAQDSSTPADAGTAPDHDVRWSGRHAVVTMPAELDITNASGVRVCRNITRSFLECGMLMWYGRRRGSGPGAGGEVRGDLPSSG